MLLLWSSYRKLSICHMLHSQDVGEMGIFMTTNLSHHQITQDGCRMQS